MKVLIVEIRRFISIRWVCSSQFPLPHCSSKWTKHFCSPPTTLRGCYTGLLDIDVDYLDKIDFPCRFPINYQKTRYQKPDAIWSVKLRSWLKPRFQQERINPPCQRLSQSNSKETENTVVASCNNRFYNPLFYHGRKTYPFNRRG